MISIIVPTYNSAEKLKLLLNSIYTGSANNNEDFETIVIDDCSSDNTHIIVKEFSSVQYIKLDNRSGPAFARNIGAKKAKGDILLFTDADTVFLPDTLSNTRKVISDNPEVKCFMGNYEKEPANRGFMPRYKALWEYSEEVRLLQSGDLKYNSFAPRPGIIYKDVFWEIGGFNDSYKGADIEDMEFGYRVNQKYDTLFSPKIKIKHHYPETLLKEIIPFARRCFLYSRLLLSRKKLDQAGESNAINALADISGFGSFIALISFYLPYNYIISLLLFIFFAGFSKNFCTVVLKEEGWRFLTAAIFVRFIHTVVMGFSVIFSLLTSPFFKRNIEH